MSAVSIAAQQKHRPNFAILVGLAWLAIVAELLLQGWADTAWTLPDADDAMRLAQVRKFLAGHGWFDLHETRLGLAGGYESHWSRLIDAGLAGLFVTFHAFTDTATAERLMVTVWPMLWLIPALIGAVAIAWRLAGREAALIVLLLAIFNLPGLQQFRAGRIDHHNVQIALAVLAVAATVWSDRVRWAAQSVGIVTGLSLAVGFEGLPIHVLCGAALALRFVVNGNAGSALGAYGLALAAATCGAFFVSVAPIHWMRSVCDAIAINSAAAVVVVGLSVAFVSNLSAQHGRTKRFVQLIGVGAVALAVFATTEPQCLAGPYAMMDPAVRPLWLAHVSEMQPFWTMAAHAPLTAIAHAAFPIVSLIATVVLLRVVPLRRDFACLTAAATFLVALATMIGAIKGFSYALWFGTPMVAAAAKYLFERFELRTLTLRFIVAMALTPSIVTVGVASIAEAAGISGHLKLNSDQHMKCTRRDSYAAFAKLPVGSVLSNELLWGPYVLAYTPHAVLGAPYHRLSRAILDSHRALAGPPEEAHKVLARAGATYIAICGSRGPTGLTGAALDASLWGRLRAGDVPAWLEPISKSSGRAVKIYRVKSQP